MIERINGLFGQFIKKLEEQLPVTSKPEMAKQELIPIINQLVIFRPSVLAFRAGQTVNPKVRQRNQFFNKPADKFIVVYKSNSQTFASEIEDFLINYYRDHRKNFNFALDPRGRTSDKSPHMVYISIKKRFIANLLDKIQDLIRDE